MTLRYSPLLKAPINLVSEQERAVGKLEGFWVQDLPPRHLTPRVSFFPRGLLIGASDRLFYNSPRVLVSADARDGLYKPGCLNIGRVIGRLYNSLRVLMSGGV